MVESSCSAVIHAPIEKVDIPDWCFSLPDSEYQACSPAHCAAGATTTTDGRRVSINVENIGGSMIVQHYVEDIGEPDHLRLVSHSDLFTPTGRTKIDVVWDLSVRKIDEETCEFTNSVHSSAPPEMLDFLGKQGIPLDVFRTGRQADFRGPQPAGDASRSRRASNATPWHTNRSRSHVRPEHTTGRSRPYS